jgi:two-component system, NarL family, sensor histidine kinase DesK
VRQTGVRQVSIALERNRGEARVSVRGDGRSVPPGSPAEDGGGRTGLDTMRKRLALAGGAVEVVALPEGGTRISARIPLAAFL